MFIFDRNDDHYFWPVNVERADRDAGRRRKFSFTGRFKRLEQPEVAEIFRPRDEGEPKVQDREIVEQVFLGWKDIRDAATGEDLEETDENRAALLDADGVLRGIVESWMKSLGIEARAKN